jgi:hypothetical protein
VHQNKAQFSSRRKINSQASKVFIEKFWKVELNECDPSEAEVGAYTKVVKKKQQKSAPDRYLSFPT